MELFGWSLEAWYLVKLVVAYLLALPIGLDRERDARSAGLRTFPLVGMASCGYLLIARDALADDPEGLGRVLYGLMTGIGFIGGGAILKEKGTVTGTATAASIWSTGAIGAAVAFGRYGVGIIIAVITVATLMFFRPLKKTLTARQEDLQDGEEH